MLNNHSIGRSNPASFGSGKSSVLDSIFPETSPLELLIGVLPSCLSSEIVMNANTRIRNIPESKVAMGIAQPVPLIVDMPNTAIISKDAPSTRMPLELPVIPMSRTKVLMNLAHTRPTMFGSGKGPSPASGACPGWLMTAVAPWGENAEDAYDQGLVEMGLGDSRLIEVQGAFLPMGVEATPPQPLPMGSLVECHLATSYAYNGGTACAGVAWAACTTPEGEECAIVAKITTELDYEETESLLKRNLQRRLASRDLEVVSFDVAVDEVTAAQDHFGVAMAALILPESLKMSGGGNVGRVRAGLTRQATDAMANAARRVDTKAPAAPAMRPGGRKPSDGSTDFSL